MQERERGFLDAIIEEPKDDAHRLVYSDWLDDHGNPDRAEFIRLQIEYDKLGYRGPRTEPFPTRMRQLLDEHKETWTRDVHPDIEPKFAFFRGGFLHEWETTVDEYARIGEEVHRRTPLTTLVLTEGLWQGDFELLASTPCLANLRNLCLGYCELADRDLAPLFSSPYLTNLRYLGLEDNEITWRTINRLIESSAFPRLSELCLNSNELSTNAIAKLANSPLMGQLEELDLSWCSVGRKGVRALAKSTLLGKLRVLDLFLAGSGGKEIELLLEAPSLVNLEELNLYSNDIDLVGAEALARASKRFTFRQLNLGEGGLGVEALDALLTADLTSLTNLGLELNPFGDEALAGFLAKADLPELKRLDISDTGTATATIQVLLDKFPQKLDKLDVTGNLLENESFVQLVESPVVENVVELQLGQSIMDKTAKMTDKTARALLGSEYLDNVLELRLRGGTFSETMRKKLEKRFGDRIRFD